MPRALTRAYPLPVEMADSRRARSPLAAAADPVRGLDERRTRARARLDRAGALLHIDIEPSVLRFVHERDWLLDSAKGSTERQRGGRDRVHGGARMLDAVRYPKLRTTFVLMHIPALAVLALYPLAPPHWVAGMPFADGPPVHPSASRNETAAAVSLHFGGPVHDRGGRAVAASTGAARLADAAVPAIRLRRHPRHGQPLRAGHGRRDGLRGRGLRRRPA